MALGLTGVVLLVGWQAEPLSASALVASLACLVAALCYGVGSVYAKARMTGIPSFGVPGATPHAAPRPMAAGVPFT